MQIQKFLINFLNLANTNPKRTPLIARGILFLFLSVICSCDLFSNQFKNQPILSVKDKSLSISQFSKQLALDLSLLDPLSAKDPQIIKKFKNKITTDFIIDALIENWFIENNKSVDPVTLDLELNKFISGFPSQKNFREELAIQNKSYQDWRKSVEMSLKRRLLFDEFKKDILAPTDNEIDAFYQSNKSNFYVNESVLTESILVVDENQAEVIKSLLKKNTFESVFKEYSLDKNKSTGPLFGWVERVPGSDIEVLFTQKKPGLIGPIKFEEGYRLFKINKKSPAHTRTLDQVKQQIAHEIISLRETARFSSWLDEQIKKHKIFKNVSAMDNLTVETRDE